MDLNFYVDIFLFALKKLLENKILLLIKLLISLHKAFKVQYILIQGISIPYSLLELFIKG